jgi:eukaryotic-like serine/threonine-protein kinase
VIAGRYALLREIGRGGMGAVWLARDEVLGREVAVKRIGMFPGSGSIPDFVRAEREARLAARLNHPHVVSVFDFVTDGETQWLVMEYVDGVTVSELARNGGLAPDEVAPIVRQAAEALAAAHQEGIVHRDVKPGNILVTPDGTAKLTDFGIARAYADATLTQTGLVTGSPAYLAPEVAAGQTATSASDVWSLGATTFHALAGQPPYDVAGNLVGALYKIVHEDPPRLAEAGSLGPLLFSTMAKDPDQRWSMAQVCDFLDGRPVEAVPPPVDTPTVIAPNPLAPPPRRRWLVPVLGALVAATIVAAGAWLLLRDGDSGGSPPAQSTPISSPTTSTPESVAPTAAGMTAFIETYLDTVADDPAAAWEMLTPEFQQESGGFTEYQQFWRPIRSATPSEIEADPETLVVSYGVEYEGPNNRPEDDRVRLQLVYEDERYLIAGEPSG